MQQSMKPSKLQPEFRMHRRLMRKLGEAIRKFCLIEDGDRVLIGLSGGKDSLALLDLLGEMMVRTNHKFELKAVHVRMKGVDYLTDTSYLEEQAAKWNVPLEVVAVKLEADRKPKRTPCFLCSWNRRKSLFQMAQEQGYNKIALGHHQDDIIRTALMNLSYNGTFSTMPAKLVMRKFPVAIIRPLSMMREADLTEWATMRDYKPVEKVCPYDSTTRRTSIGSVLESFEALSPDFRQSLWHALDKAGALMEMPNPMEN